MSTEPLGPELLRYLFDTLYNTPPDVRARSRWVMSAEWLADVTGMTDGNGRPLWNPPLSLGRVQPETLLGKPIEIREDGGAPHLEPA